MKFRPLNPWIKGNGSVTPFNFSNEFDVSTEMGAFLALDIAVDLHIANDIDTGYLDKSWHDNQKYIEEAYRIINANVDFGCDIDNEEKDMILNELREPPTSSYNIYIITTYNDIEENVVYIGKTDAKNSRFANGHLAALKLHNPKYRMYSKRVYFGTITFLSSNKEYLPLEFIQPLELAKKYLSDFEGLLIRHFNPEINVKTVKFEKLREIIIHVQNFTSVTNFLHDYFIYADS